MRRELFDFYHIGGCPPQPSALKPWFGDTVGWWEGDTFVMETINVNPRQAEDHVFPLSEKGVVTERFTRTSAEDILYEFAASMIPRPIRNRGRLN